MQVSGGVMPPGMASELTPPVIPGGTCPLRPIQCCFVWAAQQTKSISQHAFQLYFGLHEIKYWRHRTIHQPHHDEPYRIELADIHRLLPGVPRRKMTQALQELEDTSMLHTTAAGMHFTANLPALTVDTKVIHATQAMFAQLHVATRDQVILLPRRLLKVLATCGRRRVRAATLLGLLLTTMLAKRTAQYQGYQGCCKASWIARVFGVHAKRVSLERQQLIQEGWFRRLPTPQHVRNRWGEWVALALEPSSPASVAHAEPRTADVQPPPLEKPPQVQPPSSQPDTLREISKNHILAHGDAGVCHDQPRQHPTWDHILPEDLRDTARSLASTLR